MLTARHAVYRQRMREHLHNVTLRHWDTAMRIQGATALRALLELGDYSHVADAVGKEVKHTLELGAYSLMRRLGSYPRSMPAVYMEL